MQTGPTVGGFLFYLFSQTAEQFAPVDTDSDVKLRFDTEQQVAEGKAEKTERNLYSGLVFLFFNLFFSQE